MAPATKTTLPPDVLYLNLRREFFAAIANGTKRTEYREVTPFWEKKLNARPYKRILFRNGYAKDAPEMWVELKRIRMIKTDGYDEFAIELGKVLEVKRWEG